MNCAAVVVVVVIVSGWVGASGAFYWVGHGANTFVGLFVI